jgi:hypothetical protein
MERLSNHLNERNLQAEQSTQSEWQSHSKPVTMKPSGQYLAWMARIISKAISLANAPMLTEPELLVRARDWSEALHGIVPMEALNAAMSRAFENHNSTFPVNAYDLKIAYGELMLESAMIDETRTLTTDDRVDRCLNKYRHLPDRFGEIEIYLPAQDKEVVLPCGYCRTEDYNEAKARLLA